MFFYYYFSDYNRKDERNTFNDKQRKNGFTKYTICESTNEEEGSSWKTNAK